MLNQTLKSQVSKLWDKFWSGGISNPLTAIEQISYLLFMKRLDELDSKKRQDSEFIGESYASVFEGKDENLKWSNFKQMEAGEMLKHVQENVFPFIKTLGGEGSSFVKYMKNSVFIISKPSLLTEAVSIIDEIFEEIAKQEANGQGFQDTQGDLYEYLLSELKSAGKLGQFRTPRHIIQLINELVDPKLGDTICDPACGTGGFLLGAYQHIITAHTSKEQRQTDENGLTRGRLGNMLTDERQWKYLKEKTFYGYDTDDSMVRIGLMNLMMHGISFPNIEQKDTLSKKYDEDNQFDVIMANPPFKGSIDKGDINESLSVNTTKTELLFVNRIIKSLKIGGRAGVIVPDGVLFGSTRAHIHLRKMLLENTELKAVISMPVGVFLPYADASTAILIFVKGGETENVWFYDMKDDGYSLDDKREKHETSDLPDLINNFLSTETEKGFIVGKEKIVENGYSLRSGLYKSSEISLSDNLPSGWLKGSLRDFVEEVSVKAGNESTLPVFSITKYEGFVEAEKYFKKRMHSSNTSKYKVVKKGFFAYSTIHIDEGSVGLNNLGSSGIISPMYKVFKIKEEISDIIKPEFLFELLKSEKYLQIYSLSGKGSVKRRKAVNMDTFLQIPILIPPWDVQIEVANYTSEIKEYKSKIGVTQKNLNDSLEKITNYLQ